MSQACLLRLATPQSLLSGMLCASHAQRPTCRCGNTASAVALPLPPSAGTVNKRALRFAVSPQKACQKGCVSAVHAVHAHPYFEQVARAILQSISRLLTASAFNCPRAARTVGQNCRHAYPRHCTARSTYAAPACCSRRVKQNLPLRERSLTCCHVALLRFTYEDRLQSASTMQSTRRSQSPADVLRVVALCC